MNRVLLSATLALLCASSLASFAWWPFSKLPKTPQTETTVQTEQAQPPESTEESKDASVFKAFNSEGKLVEIPLSDDTILMTSTSWCGACESVHNALKQNPDLVKPGKTLVLVHSDEWEQFRPHYLESFRGPKELGILSEQQVTKLVNEFISQKKKERHPYFTQPGRIPELPYQQVFIPKGCTQCSPYNAEFFPAIYSQETGKFEDSAWETFELGD